MGATTETKLPTQKDLDETFGLLADFTELHLEPLAMRVFAAAHREHHEGVTFELAGRLTKFVQDMQLILSEVQTYVAKM
jgi:hypothetical protein